MLLDGYVRVSSVRGRSGPRFISPEVQREQILGWAKLHGHRILRVFEELDESGRTEDRPQFREALARVDRGESQGVVVARLDRFGRSLTQNLTSIERIRERGGLFVAVQDGFDLSTDTGRLVLRLMLSLAEFESDRIGTNWREAQRRAIARGVWCQPLIPAGYTRTPTGGLVLNERAAPAIRDVFHMRASGIHTLQECAEHLMAAGVKTSKGSGHWTRDAVRRVVANRVYRGEIHRAGFVNPNGHEPLIDEMTWQAAQHPLVPRTSGKHGVQLLSGLLRCANCRYVLYVRRDAKGRFEYACERRHTAGGCDSPASVSAATAEAAVEMLYWQELAPPHPPPSAARSRVEQLRGASERADADFARYRDDARISRAQDRNSFATGLARRSARAARAAEALARAEHALGTPRPSLEAMEEAWPTLTTKQRRDALMAAFDCFIVERGRLSIDRRLIAYPRGFAPVDLPRSGYRNDVTPWEPAGDRRVIRRPSRKLLPKWTSDRLERHLRGFLADRTTWPPWQDWQRAGYGRAYNEALRQGGEVYWAQRIGVHYEMQRAYIDWTDERLLAELQAFTEGWTRWPPSQAFQKAGQGRLLSRVRARGGIATWAEKLELPVLNSGRYPKWTAARITAQLDAVLDELGRWPTWRELYDRGLGGMAMAMREQGGHPAWAARMNVAYTRHAHSEAGRMSGRRQKRPVTPGATSTRRT